MTQWWVPLAAAVIAVLGTLAGVFITQRWSVQREDARWERERDREREAWAREDAARTFEQRRQVYIDLYTTLQVEAARVERGLIRALVEEGPLPDKLGSLLVYSTPQTEEAATRAYFALGAWVNRALESSDPLDDQREEQDAYDDAAHELLDAIRNDLGVPGGSGPATPPTVRAGPGPES